MRKQFILNSLVIFSILIMILNSCSKIDSTYKDFIQNGSIIYTGSPDSVQIFPGKGKLKLKLYLSDMSASSAKIYWNNRSDSAEFPVTKNIEEINFPELNEGAYSFDIYMLDKQKNKSVRTSVVARVYGQQYINGLLDRPIKTAIYSNNLTTINWGAHDPSTVVSELIYRTTEGDLDTVLVPVEEAITLLNKYDFDNQPMFKYRTYFKPEKESLDTFYTNYVDILPKGPPINYPKNNWTAPALDYDTGNPRPPQNALDGNSGTVWHMSKTSGYPHQMTVDMKEKQELQGISYQQRAPLDGAVKLVEIFISDDDITYTSIGSFTFENKTGMQYLDFISPVNCRYFRLVVRSDYKNGTTTAIAEIGAFHR